MPLPPFFLPLDDPQRPIAGEGSGVGGGVISAQGKLYLSSSNGYGHTIGTSNCVCCDNSSPTNCAEEVPYVEPFTSGSLTEPCWEYKLVQYRPTTNVLGRFGSSGTTAYARRSQITFPSFGPTLLNNDTFSFEFDYTYPTVTGNPIQGYISPHAHLVVGDEGLTIPQFSTSLGMTLHTIRGIQQASTIHLLTSKGSQVRTVIPPLTTASTTLTIKGEMTVLDEDFGTVMFEVSVNGTRYINFTEFGYEMNASAIYCEYNWRPSNTFQPTETSITIDNLTIDASS